MTIVLDTNVLMSGIFFPGIPSRILRACQRGEVELAVSNEIVAECSTSCRRTNDTFLTGQRCVAGIYSHQRAGAGSGVGDGGTVETVTCGVGVASDAVGSAVGRGGGGVDGVGAASG